MNWRSLTDAFSRHGSRNARLALSILFITLATVSIMAVFMKMNNIYHPDITVRESQMYTILFAGLVASLTSLFVLLRFEGLHQKISRENEERRHAEEALRNSEAHLNSIFRVAPAGIGVVVDRVITEANDKLCEMTGYTRDELKGKNARILYPSSEDYEYVGQEKYGQIKRLGTGAVETRWRRKDGGVIDIILSSTPMDPGNLQAGVTFTALDITERRRAEGAARAADARFRSLIQNSADVIRILDREGRIIYESESSNDILGYPPGFTLGKSPLEFIHPDDRNNVKNALDEVYEGRNSVAPIEFRIRKADGSYLYAESTGKNMFGVLGVDGVVIATRPIVERKRAEEALKAARMQADLYVDLMCHDISNMNQVGMGFLEMALDMLDLDETGREMLLSPGRPSRTAPGSSTT